MLRKIGLLVILGVAALVGQGAARAEDNGPSFDCVSALAMDEIVICADGNLSVADRELATLYDEALAKLAQSERSALRDEQKQWLSGRGRSCDLDTGNDLRAATWRGQIDCLWQKYAERERALRGLTGGTNLPIGPASEPSVDEPEYETIWRTAASDPASAAQALRSFALPRANLYADILDHALSTESDAEFQRFAQGVLSWTGSDNGQEAGVDFIRIPCALIQLYPRTLELLRSYHGGNRDNFTPRAECDPDTAGIPRSVDDFLDRTERSLRNTITSFACGSSRYGFFKNARIASIRMAFVPATYLGDDAPTDLWVPPEWPGLDAVPLERWSFASLPNRIAFEDQVRPGFKEARADLSSHYERAFGFSPEDALLAAHRALWDQVRDMGNDAGDYFPYPVDPVNQAILSGASVTEVESLVAAQDPGGAAAVGYMAPNMEAAARRPEVIRLLAAHQHPIGNAMRVAAAFGTAASIDALVAAGADVNSASPPRDRQVIRDAWQSFRSCAEVPEPALVNGAQTALMAAVAYGNSAAVEHLLTLGADKEAVDSRGYRAVDYLTEAPLPGEERQRLKRLLQ